MIKIEILTDNYAEETSWTLRDGAGTLLLSAGPYRAELDDNTLFAYEICVDKGASYAFTILDANGDGICCGYGIGEYKVTVNGVVEANGGEFQSMLESRGVYVPADGWRKITFDDFERDWGEFEDGGSNAERVANNNKDMAYVHQGVAALEIRDGSSGTSSSVYHKDSHDVTPFKNLRVSFWFKARSMENNKNFLIEYSSDGGSKWVAVKDFVIGTGVYSNDQFYNPTVDFNAEGVSYDRTSQAKIRFRCDANRKNDMVYIDEVVFEGAI
jgi:hypothetical protein